MSEESPTPPADEPEDTGGSPDIPAELPLPPLPRPPFWLMAIFLVGVVITWVPLAVIARARVSRSEEPRIHILQDMGTQPKYREQQTSEVFADGRADRQRVTGTVARGMLDEDDQYNRGFVRTIDSSGKSTVRFFDEFPGQVTVNRALLERGQQRFNIYCYVCHGYDGAGNGPVAQRATQLSQIEIPPGDPPLVSNWIAPANLLTDTIRGRPNGQIFNTITNGIRSMPPYGTQIPVADRWAIVAYVRALEVAQNAPLSVMSKNDRDALPTH